MAYSRVRPWDASNFALLFRYLDQDFGESGGKIKVTVQTQRHKNGLGDVADSQFFTDELTVSDSCKLFEWRIPIFGDDTWEVLAEFKAVLVSAEWVPNPDVAKDPVKL